MDNKQSQNSDDIWVFLSHSNKDYDSVRLLRNMLEEEGYRPIMFFLLSLNDEDEIDSLIKREIDSRKLFILCDSKNARNSAWVQKEVEYIKSSKRYYQTIRLDEPLESIRDQIIQFKKDSTIYLFYSQENQNLFPLVKKALQKDLGCKVYDWHNEFQGLSVKNAIDKALRNGYLFFLLPDGAPMTEFSMEDVQYAQDHRVHKENEDKWEHGVRTCLLKDKSDSLAYEVVGYHIHNGEIVLDEVKLYLYVMLDRIKEGAIRKEPAALYWQAYYNLHYNGYYDSVLTHANLFRQYTLNLAWESTEAGFAQAAQLYKEIYYDILYNYPEDFTGDPTYAIKAKDQLITLFPE